MKRPWQTWALFLFSLLLVTSMLGWLSVLVLRLERADREARRRADFEELVGRALWRMDAELTRLLAPEIARPYYVYQPFYRVPGRGGVAEPVPSPLLMRPGEFVRLHFQVAANRQWSAPQCPSEHERDWAVAAGIAPERLGEYRQRLEQLRDVVDVERLWTQLPVESMTVGPMELAQEAAEQTPLIQNEAVMQSGLANSPARDFADRGRSQSVGKGGKATLADELSTRNSLLQAYAQQQVVQQRLNDPLASTQTQVSEGISQPLWFGDQLVLARRVLVGDQELVQGAWIDWPRLDAHLRELIADVLPEAELEPIRDADSQLASRPTRLLATLPVHLTAELEDEEPIRMTPLRGTLLLAWLGLLIAGSAVALTLHGVVSLSERRAAFVSAVTHELRTPLTTFRMYTEMLDEGMVPDPQAQREYIGILRRESERLSHLVENVLQYARLQRGRGAPRSQLLGADTLADRVRPRLVERAEAARMQLHWQVDESLQERTLETDPDAVEQILFNLVDNACKYATTGQRQLQVRWFECGRRLCVDVQDDGPGITRRATRRLFRPFHKSDHEAAESAPGVGLGLALCSRLARDLGGQLRLASSNGNGTTFRLSLGRVRKGDEGMRG